jgi:hypothetical protein
MGSIASHVCLIAMVAHEVNKAYCQSIGDNSQPTWREAPEWQTDSAINGVEHHVEFYKRTVLGLIHPTLTKRG